MFVIKQVDLVLNQFWGEEVDDIYIVFFLYIIDRELRSCIYVCARTLFISFVLFFFCLLCNASLIF